MQTDTTHFNRYVSRDELVCVKMCLDLFQDILNEIKTFEVHKLYKPLYF